MDYSHLKQWGGAASVILILVAMALWGTNQTRAEDWVQWRGNDRTGDWTETGIMEKFPEGGLEVTWRKEIGAGYSGPVVSQGRIVTMDYQEKPGTRIMEALERVICLDEKTGEPIWADEWETHYREIMQSYQNGPRGTPSIDGDRVYAMGAAGHVRCLDFKTGELLWAKDSRKEYNTSIPIWGISSSPLVDGEKVIFITGGDSGDQVKAFNKMTGEEIWSALPTNYELGYSSPIIFEAGGARQMIIWDPKAVHSLNPETGEVYWSIPMEIKGMMAIAMPVKHGSKLLVSSFYSGSMLMEFDSEKPMAKKLWHVKGKSELPAKSVGLNSVITTPVVIGDYIYSTGSYGEFRCVKLEDSSRVWTRDDLTRQGRWGSAHIVKNGDRYFMNNDVGELLILRFTPEGPEVIDRTKLIEPDTNSGFGPRRLFASTVNWVQPAYANRHIIVRNDHEILRASLAK